MLRPDLNTHCPAQMTVKAVAARLVRAGSPFELIPHGADATSTSVFRHAPPSLNGIYRRAAASAGRPCLVFRDRTMSYGELLMEAGNLAHALRARDGIATGQRVGIVLPTSPQWLIAFIAVTSIGAVATLIDSGAAPDQIVAALAATECVAVIADESTASLLRIDGEARRPVILVRERRTGLLDQAPSFDMSIDPDQEALIAFTSGSTGGPKGVVSSHRAVITGMMNMMLGSALAATRSRSAQTSLARPPQYPSSLLLAPLTHIAGYSHLLLMMWVTGKVSVLPTWHLDMALELIKREELRTLSGASPDMLRALLRTDPLRHDLSSIAGIGVYGTSLQPELLREMHERLPGAVPLTGYGMTETNGSICVAAGSEIAERPRSCGPFVPSVQARIVDEDGHDVATGATGEIWVRGAMLMSRYCPANVESRALHEGWYRTDDFGRLDADGNLILSERRKDLVYVRGQQISCASIERLACGCGDLDDAAAFFVGEGDNTRLVVAIVPRDVLTSNPMRIRDRLVQEDVTAGCKVDIVTVASLPRTRSGKIDRHALRRQMNV